VRARPEASIDPSPRIRPGLRILPEPTHPARESVVAPGEHGIPEATDSLAQRRCSAKLADLDGLDETAGGHNFDSVSDPVHILHHDRA